MKDLIDRQAAIDALRVAYWDNNIQSAKDDPCIVDAMTDWAIRQVKALPSAQPEKRTQERTETHACDCISRQAAISELMEWVKKEENKSWSIFKGSFHWTGIKAMLECLPSAQPEPAIPLQWIEAQIEWLKSLDNAFSTLTAVQISAMVNKWKDEQDG